MPRNEMEMVWQGKRNHTPGPWELERRSDGNVELVAGDDRSPFAEFFGEDGNPKCWPVTANAQLASAAPEMLEALCGISLMEYESTSSSVEKMRAAVRIAKAAIAKARGETT